MRIKQLSLPLLLPALAFIEIAAAETINKIIDNSTIYADSIVDFSGVQGQDGWVNGYRNYTTDGGGAYTTGDFIPFAGGAGGGAWDGTTQQWTGSAWDLNTAAAGPWTFMADNNAHPNGTNSAPNEEQWAIRRYTVEADVPSAVDMKWSLGAANTNGSGTTLEVYRNGTLIDNGVTNLGSGVTGTLNFTDLTAGDVIDFALTPVGIDASRIDGADGSNFSGQIGFFGTQTLTFETVGVIAESRGEFSGVQGQDDWSYGYINTFSNNQPNPGDAHGGTFNQYVGGDGGGAWDGSSQFWSGTAWDSNTAAAEPWTFVNGTDGHPNGTNQPSGEEWVTRRWTVPAGEEGDLLVEFDLAKANNNGGTTLFVIHNGEIVGDIASSNDMLQEGFLEILGAQPGDTIDIALSPLFNGNTADGSDASQFGATIHLLVPEPGTGSLLCLSALMLATRRRRK